MVSAPEIIATLLTAAYSARTVPSRLKDAAGQVLELLSRCSKD